MEELWKPIEGYETLYEVSNFGSVRSKNRVRIDKNGIRKNYKGKLMVLSQSGKLDKYSKSYLKISLCDENKKCTQFLIHRLVAKHFIENPHNYSEVNHIDENKDNNFASNLEWCDRAYNNHHSKITEKLNESKKIKVDQLTLEGEFIKTWNGIREAARGLNMKTHRHIKTACDDPNKTSYGFKWRYHE